MEKKKVPTSDVLEGVVKDHAADRISLYDLKAALHERGFGVLMVLLSFPVAIPIPHPPGSTAIIGFPLVFLALQMVLGFDSPWLPKWIGNRSFKRSTLASLIERSAPYLRKIELLSRPRLSFTSSQMGERVIGMFCLLFAVCIALPIPFGNAVPSAGILVMSLGLLNRDGVMIIAGMVIGSIGLFIAGAILMLGIEGAHVLIQSFF